MRERGATLRPAGRLTAAHFVSALAVVMLVPAVAQTAADERQSVEIIASGQDVSIPEDATVIDIREFSYSPDSVTVTGNATVVWANREPFDHDVTFKQSELLPEEIISPRVGKGGKIVVRFNEPGEYRYYCHLHPFMEGTIRVESE